MDLIWRFLHEQAIYVSVADNAFHFDISWLGVLIAVVIVMAWRTLIMR